ncbi:MAG: EF-P lysine aminoacylase GenX, partial [Deltaproteobacteria bacterium]
MDQKKHYQNLKTRSLVTQAIRDFFTDNLYLEIETPVLSPCIIPEAHIDPVTAEDLYLQASPELCMKRMLSKGFDKIFQICKCFRRDERGSKHLPELTMLEWYAKDNTYLDLMDQCEGLIKFIAARLRLENLIRYQDKSICLNQPWQKITVKEAFDRYADKSLKKALNDNRFDEILSFQIEPFLGNTTPAFLYDYPESLASLAKLLPSSYQYAQRFEFYMAGIELANGFTELTDPVEQKLRFDDENRIRQSQNKALIPLPHKFLTDLRKMPDAAGIA